MDIAVTRPRVQADGLAEAVGLGAEELTSRKRFIEFDTDDVQRLGGLYELTQEHVDDVIEAFYDHLLAFPETSAVFRDPRLLEHVKGYLRQIAALLLKEHPGDPDQAFESFHSLTKLLFFDIGLGVDIYIYQRERTINLQQEAIRELSTPILTLRDRLLVLPIIGILDTSRAQQLTEGLLKAIRDSRAKVVILDVTGVPAVDSAIAHHLLKTVEACRLTGAQVIVTGLSSNVAQALVTLGVDLTKLNAVGDLQGASRSPSASWDTGSSPTATAWRRLWMPLSHLERSRRERVAYAGG